MEPVSEMVVEKGGWDDGDLQSLAFWAPSSRNRRALRFAVWSWLLMKARIHSFSTDWVPAMLGQVLGTGKIDQGLSLDLEEILVDGRGLGIWGKISLAFLQA